MKRLSQFLSCIILLSSCAPAVPALESTPTITLTLTPPATPQPTATLTSTITATPSLPATIEFEIDSRVPEGIVEMVRLTVNQAYWYYVDLGCSPDFHHVTITREENALTVGTDGIRVGWDDLNEDISKMSTRVSHELFHVMCQLAIQQDPDTGLDLLWLLEGNANYVDGVERLTHTGMLSGIYQTIPGHHVGMAKWISANFCDISLKDLEQGDLRKISPDFGGIVEVAASLLASIVPDGKFSFLHYYQARPELTREEAFELAFGMTLDEFYLVYDDECRRGFPSIVAHNPIAVSPSAASTLTAGAVRVQGVVILSDSATTFSDFAITFCDAVTSGCLPGVIIGSDGTFIADLKPGKYKISVNLLSDSSIVGLYSRRGLVPNWNCAEIFRVFLNQEIVITIDLQLASCPT